MIKQNLIAFKLMNVITSQQIIVYNVDVSIQNKCSFLYNKIKYFFDILLCMKNDVLFNMKQIVE